MIKILQRTVLFSIFVETVKKLAIDFSTTGAVCDVCVCVCVASCFCCLSSAEFGASTVTFTDAGGYTYDLCKQACDRYGDLARQKYHPPYPINMAQYATLVKRFGDSGIYSFWTNLLVGGNGVVFSRHNVSNETFPVWGLKPDKTPTVHPNISMVETSHNVTAKAPDRLAIYFHNNRYIAAKTEVKVDKCVCVRGKEFELGRHFGHVDFAWVSQALRTPQWVTG